MMADQPKTNARQDGARDVQALQVRAYDSVLAPHRPVIALDYLIALSGIPILAAFTSTRSSAPRSAGSSRSSR